MKLTIANKELLRQNAYINGEWTDAQSAQTFAGADLFLHWSSIEGGVILRSTGKTRADRFGRFRFAGLGPGRHELVATAWHSDSDLRTVRQTVNLGVESGELILLVDHR